MPKGFLIKRKKHQADTWLKRRGSEDWDVSSESGSDQTDHKRFSHDDHTSGALDLCIKRSKTVFDEGLDLTTKHTGSDNESDTRSDGLDSKKSESDDVISVVSKNLHLKQSQIMYKEFNNNTIPNPRVLSRYADYNRENFKHYLPSALPVSNHRSLSISTNQSNWSPFYLAAFDHLSVSVSPTSNVSSHGSPQELIMPPSTQQTAQIKPTIAQQQSTSPAKKRPNPSSNKPNSKHNKKQKTARKIEFDDSSPVSGTYIREENGEEEGIRVVSGDIDTNLNIVEVTPEAEAELAKIDNKIGEYKCRLCKETFESAFGLAQHRCSRIVHVEYRCPECDKVFNCSANLASHRRWHKPRSQQMSNKLPKLLPNGQIDPDANRNIESDSAGHFTCRHCGKLFKRQAYLKKHMATHSERSPPLNQGTADPAKSFQAILGSEASRLGLLRPPIPDSLSPRCKPSPLMCPICSVNVHDTVALEDHIRRKHTEVFPCKLCSSTFYNLTGLTSHVAKCHPSLDHPVMLQIPTYAPRPC